MYIIYIYIYEYNFKIINIYILFRDVSDNEFDNTIFDTILKLKNLDFLLVNILKKLKMLIKLKI